VHLDLVNLLAVIAAAWTAGRLCTRIGYPAILGELLVGILLGPAALGLLEGDDALMVLAELGVLLMMTLIGMEIDLGDLRRASWPGLLAAVGGFVTPFVLGYLAVIAFGGDPIAGIFVGLAVGVTSLATKSRILSDLGLLDTRMAHVMMAGALLSDTATLLVFAGVIGFVEVGSVDAAGIGRVALEAVVFFGVAGLLGWKAFPIIGRLVGRSAERGRTATFLVIVVLALGFAELAELAGLHAILGSFVAGLFIRKDTFHPRVVRQTEGVLHDVSIGFLAPIFFVTAGFEVSFDVFRTDLALLLTIVGVAFAGKILGTALFYLPSGRGWREGLTVGMAMNGRGAVEIVVAGIGLEAGIITTEIFSILVFMAIFTTATVPLLLKWGVDWLARRGELERSGQSRKGTILVGAGPVARALAERMPGPVCVIDVNRDHCDAAEAMGLRAICGDALDEAVLRQAGAGGARTLLAMTANSEVNVLAVQLGHELFAVPELSVLLGRSASDAVGQILSMVGARPMDRTAADIAAWDQHLREGVTVADDVEVGADGAGLPALQSSEDVLPLVVTSNDDARLFRAVDDLHPGDRVAVLRRSAADGGTSSPSTPSSRAAT
jgi:Kef-type K+ transport system membrane component KefB